MNSHSSSYKIDYVSNYKYSTISSIEKYLTNQIIEDHKKNIIELSHDIHQKELEIDIDSFQKSNQILFIRNLSILSDIFTSSKSSIQPMTFFYKDIDYIVFFSKLSNSFPFIIIRLKESKKIQCKDSNSAYEFPINDIFKKEIINRKRFDIILDNVGYLKYDIIGYDESQIEIKNEIKTSNGRNKTIINDIIDNKSLIEPFQNYLMNTFICMIKQEDNRDKIITFDNDVSEFKTYLIIDNDEMIIEIEKNSSKLDKYLSPTTVPIIKAKSFNKGKYIFEHYRQTFRLPYQKLVNIKTRVNYCLVHSGDDYYFLKVFAKYDFIKDAERLCDVFNTTDTIIEGYRLKPIQ